MISPDNAIMIGTQIVEMAERVTRARKHTPRMVATWKISIADKPYKITVEPLSE